MWNFEIIENYVLRIKKLKSFYLSTLKKSFKKNIEI